MKLYRGYRLMRTHVFGKATSSLCRVTVDDGQVVRLLRPRLDVRNHSPTGYEWGYCGSGPAQLALALVADLLGESLAVQVYQHVKSVLVSRFAPAGFLLTEIELRAVVDSFLLR